MPEDGLTASSIIEANNGSDAQSATQCSLTLLNSLV